VVGNFRPGMLEKGRLLDDRPCSVKGRSLSNVVSGGSIST
jgi:hypothetical protein